MGQVREAHIGMKIRQLPAEYIRRLDWCPRCPPYLTVADVSVGYPRDGERLLQTAIREGDRRPNPTKQPHLTIISHQRELSEGAVEDNSYTWLHEPERAKGYQGCRSSEKETVTHSKSTPAFYAHHEHVWCGIPMVMRRNLHKDKVLSGLYCVRHSWRRGRRSGGSEERPVGRTERDKRHKSAAGKGLAAETFYGERRVCGSRVDVTPGTSLAFRKDTEQPNKSGRTCIRLLWHLHEAATARYILPILIHGKSGKSW